MKNDLTEYYARRAAEYEAIYRKPERQRDLLAAAAVLQEIFKNRSVIEIACGTGYWTEIIARSAKNILATDINAEVLDIARRKDYPHRNVAFEMADLYRLKPEHTAEALFGGFIWSHIKKSGLPAFIDTANGLVQPGGTVVFIDNCYVPGSSTAIAEQDAEGNTYQHRKLQNGDVYAVLKNFPAKAEIEALLRGRAHNIRHIDLTYFWIVAYET